MNRLERKLDRLKPVQTFRTPEQHRNIIQPEPKPKLLPSPQPGDAHSKEEKKRRRKKRRNAPQKQVKAVIPRSKKDAFYESWEWKRKRLEAIKRDGRRCLCCGAGPEHGVRIVVDHIKPLGEFWELRLELDNLQVLCNDCNQGKGNWDQTDFRPD